MNLRPVMIVVFALAVLVARISGLHFHLPESHHGPATEHVHADDHPTSSLLASLASDHLPDHLDGAQDVDTSATLTGAMLKMLVLFCALVFLGMAFFLMLFAGSALPVRPPLRPPRLWNPAEILPPSRGPPLAA